MGKQSMNAYEEQIEDSFMWWGAVLVMGVLAKEEERKELICMSSEDSRDRWGTVPRAWKAPTRRLVMVSVSTAHSFGA